MVVYWKRRGDSREKSATEQGITKLFRFSRQILCPVKPILSPITAPLIAHSQLVETPFASWTSGPQFIQNFAVIFFLSGQKVHSRASRWRYPLPFSLHSFPFHKSKNALPTYGTPTGNWVLLSLEILHVKMVLDRRSRNS